MMRKVLVLTICCLTGVAGLASAAAVADETKPIAAAETNAAALEVRADQHFAAGEWALARPMYKKLVDMVKGDPAKLGPVEERLRACDKNIAKLTQANLTASPPARVPAAPPTSEQRMVHTAPYDGQTIDI